MRKAKNLIIENLHWFTVGGVAALIALFLIFGHPNEDGFIVVGGSSVIIEESTEEFIKEAQEALITYAETAVPAVIENADGTLTEIEAPTVESIDGGEIFNSENCPEGEECGLGAYIYAPTDTYEHFKDYTYGKCWNIDGYAGSQCWDLSSLHAMNYTNDKRVFSTCGTGAAKGMWACKEQNAGTEYDLVYSVYDTHVGDIAVFGGGTWGHTGVIAGPVVNGYVALLGQNQGGSACPGGGAATNIINISVKDFLGAFHPKTYVDPEPTPPSPEPVPEPISNCQRWTLVWGDTLGKIMKTCEGKIEWGEAMNLYAQSWVDESTGRTVFEGWSTYPGIGLYAGHVITKK